MLTQVEHEKSFITLGPDLLFFFAAIVSCLHLEQGEWVWVGGMERRGVSVLWIKFCILPLKWIQCLFLRKISWTQITLAMILPRIMYFANKDVENGSNSYNNWLISSQIKAKLYFMKVYLYIKKLSMQLFKHFANCKNEIEKEPWLP